jgi:hypothetical protein
MSRPPFEVADIVRSVGNAFRDHYGGSLTWPRHKALDAIARCRTAALGGQRDQCISCGREAISYNSCRNRHCPSVRAVHATSGLPGASRNCRTLATTILLWQEQTEQSPFKRAARCAAECDGGDTVSKVRQNQSTYGVTIDFSRALQPQERRTTSSTGRTICLPAPVRCLSPSLANRSSAATRPNSVTG